MDGVAIAARAERKGEVSSECPDSLSLQQRATSGGTLLKEAEVKTLLDALIDERERNFTVVFSASQTARLCGIYNPKVKEIVLYEKFF